jgi:hypothetical protein
VGYLEMLRAMRGEGGVMTSSTPLTDAIVAKYIGHGLSARECNELLDHARTLEECVPLLADLAALTPMAKPDELQERARALLSKLRGDE